MPLVILALLIGLPIILLFLFRSNAAIVFLALCAGSILLKYVGNDASLLFNSFFSHSSSVVDQVTDIVLLTLPAILTAVFLRHSVSGAKAFLNLLPAVATGGLLALSLVPLLSPITSSNVMATQAWSYLQQFQSLIVGAGAFTSLLLLWATSRKKHDKDKKHKK